MAFTDVILGANCKAYINTNMVSGIPSLDVPTWVAMNTISDIDFPSVYKEADVSSRVSSFDQMEPTQGSIAGTITFPVKWATDTNNVIVSALFMRAHWARMPLDLMFLDLPLVAANLTGVQSGIRAQFKSFKMSEPQKLDNAVPLAFDLKLCYSPMAPKFVYLGTEFAPGSLLFA